MKLLRSKSGPRQPNVGAGKVPLTYYRSSAGKTPDNSPFNRRESRPERRRLLFKSIDYILLLGLLVFLGYSLVVSANPKVVASDTYRPVDEYRVVAARNLGSFGNHNKLTFNEQRLVNDLMAQFPEIDAVNVELPMIGQRPLVHLDIAKPAINLSSASGQYLVSSTGSAVGKSQDLPQIKGLTTLQDNSGFLVKNGEKVLSSASVKFISEVIVQAQLAHVSIKSLTLPQAPMELDLVTADQPYQIKFYLGGNAEQQIGQFLAARKYFAEKNITPNQYLDARILGKIFYK